MAGKCGREIKRRTCRGLSFLEGRRALAWASQELGSSRPLCRPPPSPPARGAGPLAPALPLAGADWPVGVTCKGGGGSAPQRLHRRWAPGCGAVQKAPPAGKVQAQGSRKMPKCYRRGARLHPVPCLRSVRFAVLLRVSAVNEPRSPPPAPPPASWRSRSSRSQDAVG